MQLYPVTLPFLLPFCLAAIKIAHRYLISIYQLPSSPPGAQSTPLKAEYVVSINLLLNVMGRGLCYLN